MTTLPSPEQRLWYRQPARDFVEALPLGNGALGAMTYGGVTRETVELNADTLWSGGPADTERHGPAPAVHLGALRDAVLRDRDYAEADRLSAHFQGPFGQAYQPLGTLHLDLHGAEADEGAGADAGAEAAAGDRGAERYVRSLDLDRAVHTVEYHRDGTRFRRESFLSAPADRLVLRLTADRPSALAFTARLTSPHPAAHHPAGDAATLITGRAPAHLDFDTPAPLTYRPDAGMGFAAGLRVTADPGTVRVHDDGTVQVHGATEAVLTVHLATGYRGWTREPAGPEDGPADDVRQALAAPVPPYAELLHDHLRDHGELFARSTLALGDRPAPDLPTDERLLAFRKGEPDPGLAALLFAYGRYLLIASSRPGSQPANLQGIWNRDPAPPWNSNWTTNINLPMNYWPAEATGLPECHQPLLDLVEDLVEAGAATARELYDCRGWTAHHNLDLWRSTGPVAGSPSWAMWPMAGVWLCAHLWEHYRYGGDRHFLEHRAYPALRGAADFLLDFLVPDENGELVTCPSTSPEHHFVIPAGDSAGGLAAVSAASTMDLWLAEELLAHCSEAARVLGVDADLARRWDRTRTRLRRPRIARGRLQEWWEDFPPEDAGHRHLSHLYGVHPGDFVDPEETPDLARAAHAALLHRLDNGSGSTGWSAAWAAALAARLGDAETALRCLTDLIGRYTFPNLVGMCPPSILQMDASFGATAAIARMLLDPYQETVKILPALPEDWSDGRVHGLRAPDGLVIDLEWHAGSLTEARVTTRGHHPVTLVLPGGAGPATLTSPTGEAAPFHRENRLFRFVPQEPGTHVLRL